MEGVGEGLGEDVRRVKEDRRYQTDNCMSICHHCTQRSRPLTLTLICLALSA